MRPHLSDFKVTLLFYFIYLACILLSHLAIEGKVHGSDDFNVPLLVKHHQESHFMAGAVVGLGMDAYLREVSPHLKPLPRFLISVATALTIGTFKEHVMDHTPRNKEIGPWGLGAAAALSIRFTF